MISEKEKHLENILRSGGPCIVAASGGMDSLVLASFASGVLQEKCRVIHAAGASVPLEAARRVREYAVLYGWRFEIIEACEMKDENYARNPVDRCFFCKSSLYGRLKKIASQPAPGAWVVYSGTNTDDLEDYRPGLKAAEEESVRHPFVEAGFSKEDIRLLARKMKLSVSEVPAQPCLASRIYTGTRVTEERLLAVDAAEVFLRSRSGIDVLRCRILEDGMRIETHSEDASKIDSALLDELRNMLKKDHSFIQSVEKDPRPYAPGRAFRKEPVR